METILSEFKENYIDRTTGKIYPLTWEQLKPKLEQLLLDNASRPVQVGVIRQLPKHWQIDLMVDGENILSIGDNHLSGLDDLTPYEDFISSASETLKNFTSRNTLGV